MNSKFFYIYNPKQALFFIKNGGFLIDINKGNKGDTYYQFPRDIKHEELFLKWKKEKYGEYTI